MKEIPNLADVVIDTARVIVLVLDTEGRIVRFNRYMEELSGYRLDEVRGRDWFETFLPRRDRSQIRRLFLRAIQVARTRGNVNPIVTRDGRERLIEWYDSLLEASTGEIVGLLAIGQDVTERQRAEEELRSARERAEEEVRERTAGLEHAMALVERQEARLAEAQRIAHLGSWEWNVATGELFWSDEVYRIFGETPRSFGATYEAFLRSVHPEDRDAVRHAVDRALEARETYAIDHRVLRPDGEVRVVHEQGEVTWDEAGRPVRMMGTVLDVTEERRVREELKRSLAEKETLLQEIHHRVKNNLQVISSLLYLQSKKIREPGARAMYESSRSRVRSMALIHEQLYKSKELGRIHFGNYLRQLAATICSSFHVDPAKVSLEIDAEDVYLDIARAVPCGLVVNELVTNALRHAFVTKTSGRVGISLAHGSDGGVSIRVADDGDGLPPGVEVEKPGSLGLQLVRNLAKQLEGKIDIDSKEGTAVTLTLPGQDPDAGARPTSGEPAGGRED